MLVLDLHRRLSFFLTIYSVKKYSCSEHLQNIVGHRLLIRFLKINNISIPAAFPKRGWLKKLYNS